MLLGSAMYRLSFPALDAFTQHFQWYHWTALAVNVVFMGYSEGYRGFQQGFSRRVVARARYLRDHPSLVRVLLAPLFCMGFFHAVPRRKIVAYSLTAGIIVLVITVRSLPQPWRGIVDVGVVFGLVWGVAAMGLFAFAAFTGGVFDHPPEVPEVRYEPAWPA